jgi:rhodanese-related sulfurtransferase
MSFAKNLIGGAAIIAIALIVGVAQNAVRSDPVRLFPKIRQPASPAATAATPAPSEHAAKSVEISSSPHVTKEELAAGEMSMARLRTILEGGAAIIIDARSSEQFDQGHLPGALNVPIDDFIEYHSRLDERVPIDATVIVYCQSVTCDQSENLARELGMMGYERVLVYRGGWDEWSQAGLPTE